MDSERIYSLIRQNILPIFLGLVGIILVLIGLAQFFMQKPEPSPLVFEESTKVEKQEITIDVAGAVMKPGVYKLPFESRIVDTLASAGGLSEDADRNWVEKNINLAQKVSDGLKIYIPRVGEEVLSQSSANSLGSIGPVLNINTADSSDLESLPGIGPVTASEIINARPYSDISDLLDKKIVGKSVFDKIKDKISAN